jgi:AraC family transcriptional regulator
MEAIDRINGAIRYIEDNLRDVVSYDEISKITLFPISAFQRFFSLTTGMTLSEYIRRRRLSCSALDLLKISGCDTITPKWCSIGSATMT